MMSNQTQRMRKTISPGAATKQGPIRATVPLSLMHQTCSPTKCLKGSPSKSPPVCWSADRVKTRLSPDNRISPETHAASTGCRVEPSKPATKTSPVPYIRRTASVDTLYLLGQWQRDALYLSYCGRLMMDRATQTPDEFDESDRKLLQKRCGSTCGDTLEMKFIRQRLQRTGHSPRLPTSPSTVHQRQSPLPGDHSVISSSTGPLSPALPSNTSPLQGAALSAGNNNTSATYSSFTSSSHALPIPIPDIPKPLIPRMRSSVEGLNQEIERIVLKQVTYYEGEDTFQKREPTPEGHRAPIADLFRNTQSVDTQTPFDYSDGYLSSNSSNSGSQSVSPAVPLILGHMDTSRPSSTGGSDLFRVCYYSGLVPSPSQLNVTLCTHIIAGFSYVKDGLIDMGNETSKTHYRETTALKKSHPHLKVLLTVGGGGNDDGFSNAVASLINRTRFISSALTVLDGYDFDGLDIDWEFPVWNDHKAEDKQNFLSFLKEFKFGTALLASMTKKSLLLTVAVAAPKTIVDQSYNVLEMAKYVDFINLMSYDFHDYFWYTPFTDHNSPLFNRSVEKAYFSTLNTAWSATYWHQLGMPKSKIIVGIPTYGHTYKLLDPDLNTVDAPATSVGLGDGDVSFTEVCEFLLSGGVRVFDHESQVPYAYKDYDWISYEDGISLLGKAKWIKENGFGGAMTYDLNSDDWSGACSSGLFPLHTVLYNAFLN